MSLSDLDWPVRTERLSLRPAVSDDALPTYAYRSLSEVAQWLTELPKDPDAWVEAFPKRAEKTLIVELDGAVIGDLYLHVTDPWSQLEVRDEASATMAEIGYAFDPAHSGRGFATEACVEELRICFEEIGVRRVVAACFADNEPSWRLMERLGMRREQYGVRDSLHRSGEWLDGMTYALLVEEWELNRRPGWQG